MAQLQVTFDPDKLRSAMIDVELGQSEVMRASGISTTTARRVFNSEAVAMRSARAVAKALRKSVRDLIREGVE